MELEDANEDKNTLTKRKLVLKIAAKINMRQSDVMDVLQLALDYIKEELAAGHTVEFRDFGVFEVLCRKSRIGRNPNKPQNTVNIPERSVVKFKPGKDMKKRVLELDPSRNRK